jgi:AcrR family transcriptional regulator
MIKEHSSEKVFVSLPRVLPIAEVMMVEEGLQAVTVPAVAEATGYPVEALSKYFPNSSRLRGAILLRHATAQLKRMREESSKTDDPVEKVRVALQCKMDYSEENPVVMKLFQARFKHAYENPIELLPEPAKSLWKAYDSEELDWIKRAQRQNRIRDDLAPASVQQLIHVLIEWSFDDVEVGKRCNDCRSVMLWDLFCSTIGVPVADKQRTASVMH